MFDFSSSLFWYKLIFMTELLIAELLAIYTLKKRKKFYLRAGLCILSVYALSFLFPILAYNAIYSTMMFFILFVATIIVLKICYDESWINILFCSLIAYTVQHIAYELNGLISLIFDLQTINVYLPGESITAHGGALAINAVVYLATFAIVYWFVWAFIEVRIRRQKELILGNFYLILWVVITLIIDIVLSAIITYLTEPISKTVLIIFMISNIVGCILSMGYQFLMLDKDNVEHDLKITEHLWKIDKERFELSKENIELLNIRCHDLKSQISALRNINGFVDENTIIELENALNFYGMNIKTGNDALDVILAEKHILCEKKSIRLSCMINGEKLNFISSVKLYSLFGNALQNAIESTEQIEDERKRLIILNVKNKGNFVLVHLENSCPEGETLQVVNGLPQTTKKDKEEHGYGMRSIQMICEEFGGGLDFRRENDRFYLDIMIPIPETSGVVNEAE